MHLSEVHGDDLEQTTTHCLYLEQTTYPVFISWTKNYFWTLLHTVCKNKKAYATKSHTKQNQNVQVMSVKKWGPEYYHNVFQYDEHVHMKSKHKNYVSVNLYKGAEQNM